MQPVVFFRPGFVFLTDMVGWTLRNVDYITA